MNQNPNEHVSLDDYDEEARHPERYPNKVLQAIAKYVRWFFAVLAAVVFAVMIWRIQTMESVPSSMQTLTVNEATYQAYQAALSRGETLEMLTQSKLDPISTNSEAYGYFWIAESVIIPEAEQLQLVVRYNNSTLKYLAEDYQLTEIPSRDTEVLCLRLRVIRDATPDNPEDNEEQDAQIVETLTPTGTPTAARQDVYNFRRFVFDDVAMDDDVIALVVAFYYAGDADAEQPLTELYAYYELAETKKVKMTKKDRQALEEYGEK